MSEVSAQHVVTGDGVKLAYERHGVKGPVVVFIHGVVHTYVCKLCACRTDQYTDQMLVCSGWSGSRHYFDYNAEVEVAEARCEADSACDTSTLFAGCREDLPGVSI